MSLATRIAKIMQGQDKNSQRFGTSRGSVPTAAAAYLAVAPVEQCDGIMHRTLLSFTALQISVADDAGVAQYGGTQVYTFPEGLLCTHGMLIDGVIGVVSGTIIAAFTGKIALGSAVATTGATLVSTEATFLQETALTTASSSVAVCDAISIATQLTESGGRVYDGTATAAPLFLNLAIADDASHTAAVLYFTGTIQFTWHVIGDK